jgi:hypothetical protein
MRRTAFLLLAATTTLGASVPAATPAISKAVSANAQFAALSKRYVDSLARFSPVGGTQLGDHRFDDKLPDITARGRATKLRSTRRCWAIWRGSISRR